MKGPNLGEDEKSGATSEGGLPQITEPDMDSPVYMAAKKGDILMLGSLIQSNEKIDEYNVYRQHTPLHVAIRGDHAEAVKLLLEAGADPELLDYTDTALDPPYPALDIAAWIGSSKSLEVLIDHGVALSPSSLALAASLNQTDCMTIILRQLNNDIAFIERNPQCMRTALIAAAQCWHTEAVELLLTHAIGFPKPGDNEDQAALTEALFMALCDYCCDHHCREWLYRKSPEKYEALPERFLSMLQNLVQHGADINATDPENGMTRFWLLASPGPSFDLEIALSYLLSKGLRVDEGQRTDEDTGQVYAAPIMIAVAYINEVDTIKAMVMAGASTQVIDQSLRTPLHFARTRTIAEYLCDLGADVLAKDDQGMAPLHMACHQVHADVVDVLISRGANVHERATEYQWTPLHFATCGGFHMTSHYYVSQESWAAKTSRSRLETVKVLLQNSANIQATALDGQTALHGAAGKGDINLMRYLLEQGADVNAATTRGETALHIVASINSIREPTEAQVSSMMALLLDHGANLEATNETGATPLRMVVNRSISSTGKMYPRTDTSRFNMLIERGADKFAEDNMGTRIVDLVDTEDWDFDEVGRLSPKIKA